MNNKLQLDDRFLSYAPIAVTPGDMLVGSYKAPSGNTAAATIYSVGFYNETWLYQTASVSNTIYTVPADVTKIGVTFRSATYGENLQIEINSSGTFSKYEPYEETQILQDNVIMPEVADARSDYSSLGDRLSVYDSEIQKLNSYNSEFSFNLLDFSKAVDGYLNSRGEVGTTPVSASSIYITTDYIEAVKGEKLVASSSSALKSNIVTITYYAEYDENKLLLRYDSTSSPFKECIEDGTKYVRISIRKASYPGNLKIEKNSFGLFTTYTPYELVRINKPSYVFMPQYIYCAVGRTIEVYNNQIMLDADNYHIQWVCNVGTGMGRKYVVEGTTAMLSTRSDSALANGQYRLWFNAYDGNKNLVWQGCSILCIVSQLSSSKTVLPIGDSLTNWKRWEPEIMNLSGQKVSFIGTRYSGLDHDASGNEYATGVIHHEGRSGWSADNYLHNSEYTFDNRYDGVQSIAGTTNPFWDGNKFSLLHYLTAQGKTTPSAVQIWLGTNDLGNGIDSATENILSIVNTIRNEYPALKILLCSTIYKSRQDGYGRTGGQGYAANAGATAYQLEEDAKVMELTRNLAEVMYGASNVFIIPLYCSHDSEYNFGRVEVPVNPRAVQKTYIPEEAIHPAEQGYYQIADILYSAYSALLN